MCSPPASSGPNTVSSWVGLGKDPWRVGPHSPLFVYQSCCPVTKELSEEL